MRKAIGIILLLSVQYLYSQSRVTLTSQRNDDNSVDIYYEKDTSGSHFINMNFTSYDNTFTPESKFIVNANNGILCKLRPIDKNKSIIYSYKYTFYRGIPNPKYDPEFVYLLPFKNNTSIEARFLTNIDAKYFDKQEPKNWKSFQFICTKADSICSARKGIVVNVVDNYAVDTTKSYSYSSQRNSIMIEHKDGTFAKYEGFDSKSIFVKLGDLVLPNQPLGKLVQYDKSGVYQLRFTIDYLFENSSEKENTIQRFSYANIDPNFQTSEGIVKLASRKIYTTKISEELVLKELTKSELKKLKKK